MWAYSHQWLSGAHCSNPLQRIDNHRPSSRLFNPSLFHLLSDISKLSSSSSSSSSSLPRNPYWSMMHHWRLCNQLSPSCPVLHSPLGVGDLQPCVHSSKLSFSSPLSWYFVRWFLRGQMIVRRAHTTSVCASWALSGGLRMVRWLVGSGWGPLRW